MGWHVDESLQSGTMTWNEPTKLLVWKRHNNKIRYKRFLLVAGGIGDSASMDRKSRDADWDRRTSRDESSSSLVQCM